jgi:UDP-2-acetamido-3-amino-2,3-dideoxy-glucuronate N-acetyltransferase
MIGAGSVVTKDIPDYALAYGNPAEIEGSVDKSGKKK